MNDDRIALLEEEANCFAELPPDDLYFINPP